MEDEPLGEREVAERGVFDEEVGAAGRQQLARKRLQQFDPVAELPLDRLPLRAPGEAGEARHGGAPGNSFHRPHPRILRVNLLRRHPIALALIVLVVWSSVDPLPALVDAVTRAPAADADLTRPIGYLLLAPLSDVLDALTFLSL